MNEVYELNDDLDELRSILKLSKHYTENKIYKIYLKEIEANEDVIVKGWIGKDYERYIPYVIGTVILCIILFVVFYFVSKRL